MGAKFEFSVFLNKTAFENKVNKSGKSAKKWWKKIKIGEIGEFHKIKSNWQPALHRTAGRMESGSISSQSVSEICERFW